MTTATGTNRTLRDLLLPEHQRRTVDQLTDDLDLDLGDTRSKRTAFWTMLTLAGVIACAGVRADSTATVIGAMIIAPLSTPIMGMALAVVKRERIGSLRYVFWGGALVIALGALFSVFIPGSYDLLSNSQVAGRTSPAMVDLVAALATGFAGAVGLARRDVAAVLPGVAISISLVPPLAVVGICLGEGAWGLAAGALVLFLSNLLALVFAGGLVFAAVVHGAAEPLAAGRRPVRVYVTFALMAPLVLIPLAVNSLSTYAYTELTDRVSQESTAWIRDVPGAEVTDVQHAGTTAVVSVSAPGELPPVSGLLDRLSTVLPAGIPVVVERRVGERIEVGTTT